MGVSFTISDLVIDISDDGFNSRYVRLDNQQYQLENH